MIEQLKQEIAELTQVLDRLNAAADCISALLEQRVLALQTACSHPRVLIERSSDYHQNRRYYSCLICKKDLDYPPEGSEAVFEA